MASRTGERTLRGAGGWARVRPWRDRDDVAHLAVATEVVVSPVTVDHWVERLRADGYQSVVTSPLTEPAARPFLERGFRHQEHLHLLAHPLGDMPPVDPNGPELRRAWRGDRRAVIELDAHAFRPDWQLGAGGLREALRATPAVRFRLADSPARAVPAAYAVTGRAGERGYLQRLAVHPDVRGHGFGRALVTDALRWLHRHRARRCLVNTQQDNHGALGLYEACGFRRLPAGLAVLGSDL